MLSLLRAVTLLVRPGPTVLRLRSAFHMPKTWLRPLIRRNATSEPDLYIRHSTDIAHVLELWIVGVRSSAGRLLWRRRWAVALVVVSSVPIAWAVFLDHALEEHPPANLSIAYYGWLSYFAALMWVEVLFGWIGVTTFRRLTLFLAQMLTSQGRRTYDAWADVATAPLPQAAFSLVFSAGACCALRIAAVTPGIDERLYVAPPSYASVALTSLFIAQGMYWLVAHAILSILLTRSGHLSLDWYAPAYTAGVELLAQCYRFAFYGASLAVALCLFPILTWAYKAPANHLFLVVKVSLFILSLLATLSIAFIPQWRLSAVVAEARRNTIEQLRSILPKSASEALPGNDVDTVRLAWLQTVMSSPSTTVKDSTVVGILLGLATAVLPYLMSVL